jgi:hypothetical protein
VRLQPLGHLSGVDRWEGTSVAIGRSRTMRSIRSDCVFSILWVNSRNPQLERIASEEGTYESFSEGFPSEAEDETTDEPDPDAPAAAAFAAPFVGAEAGNAGTFALSTTW